MTATGWRVYFAENVKSVPATATRLYVSKDANEALRADWEESGAKRSGLGLVIVVAKRRLDVCYEPLLTGKEWAT